MCPWENGQARLNLYPEDRNENSGGAARGLRFRVGSRLTVGSYMGTLEERLWVCLCSRGMFQKFPLFLLGSGDSSYWRTANIFQCPRIQTITGALYREMKYKVDVTGAPYREVNSKVATSPNTQSRR